MKSDVYRGKLQAQVQPNAAKLKLSAERTTNKEQLRATAVKAWQSNSREEATFGADHGFEALGSH